MRGTILGGRYNIINTLGSGGFGTTFLAQDRHLPGTPLCALKQLKPVATDPATLQIARRLFDTEAKVLHELGCHESIPKLFAYFEENQEFYLVQEFVEGRDLSEEILPGDRLEEAAVISLLQELLEILAFVHQKNVIHRDINPRNILRREGDKKLALIDFGAVKQLTTQMVNAGSQSLVSVCIGTPGYLPSEQANGNPKPSSDIYAVGVLAIQALTGLCPSQFPLDPQTNEINWHDVVEVSAPLQNVIDKMVRYDFRDRYPSAVEALQAINDLSQPTAATFPVSPALVAPPKLTVARSKFLVGAIAVVVLGVGTAIASVSIMNTINSSTASELYSKGLTLSSLNRYEEALKSFEKGLKIKPDFVDLWESKGETLYELNRYQDGLDAFDRAIQLSPSSVTAWRGRGYVLNQLERFEEAIAAFEKAIAMSPDSAQSWSGKGNALVKLQRYEEAIAAYDEAVELQPEYPEAWYSRGWALHQLNSYEKAFESYDKAVNYQFDYPVAWYHRGNVLMQMKDYEKAVESYDKAVRFQPNFHQAWYSRGSALSHLEQYEEAIGSYEKAVKFKPSYQEAWYHLGWARHELRRYEAAIDAYNKALDLNRNHNRAWYNRGNALYNLNRYQEAIYSYDEAVYVKPDDAESWYGKGNSLVKLNRYEEAIAAYEKALRYQPNYNAAKDGKKQAEKEIEKRQKALEEQQSR